VDPGDGKAKLVAWDPVAQKPRWQVQHDTVWNGGVLVTAGNIVFQGTTDGNLTAYDDATSGKQLWVFNAGMGKIAGLIRARNTLGSKRFA
jgi:quinohemoprotein ethanol dehydrogenase